MTISEEKCDMASFQNCTKDVFWYLGAFLVFFIIFKLLRSLWRGIYSCFLADLLGFTVKWKKLGEWAVVTGATDGIGKAYAKALASKGFNVFLISRTQEKLAKVAEEFESKYKIKTKTLAIDFTSNPSFYDKIEKNLDGLDIGVLVNNVGLSYKYAEYLTKVEDGGKFAEDVIKMNILSVTRMTQIVLPQMEKKRKGVIINVSSLSALSPVPLLSMYGAAKSYVNFFTSATQEEYKSKGIIVQSVLPGFVSTNMSKMRPSLTVCTAESFVRWAMKTVGVEERTYGYPMHKLQGYGQEFLRDYFPENVSLVISHRMLGSIRKRYYKKFGLVEPEDGVSKVVRSDTSSKIK